MNYSLCKIFGGSFGGGLFLGTIFSSIPITSPLAFSIHGNFGGGPVM